MIAVVWLAAIVAGVCLGLAGPLGMEIGTLPLIGASVGLLLLVLALGSVTFAVGAVTGRRTVALLALTVVSLVVAVVVYDRRDLGV